MTFKAGDVVEYRGPLKENFGKQYTIKAIHICGGDIWDYADLLEERGFIPHLKNLIHVNVSLENE